MSTMLEIETTSLCNARCPFCTYTTHYDLKKKQLLSTEIIMRIIQEAAEYGIEWLAPYGINEPLTDQRIHDFSCFATSLGMKVEISSNGMVMPDWFVHGFSRMGITLMLFSVPSINTARYSRIMGKDCLRHTLTNILNFASFNKKLLSTIFINVVYDQFDSEALADVQNSRIFWESHGIQMRVSERNYWGGNLPHSIGTFHREVRGCCDNRPWEHLFVNHLGEVRLCCMDTAQQSQVSLGTIFDRSFREIWESDAFNLIREKIQSDQTVKDFVCRKCEWATAYPWKYETI